MHDFTARINELEEVGLWIFAGAQRGTYRIGTALGEKTVKMTTAAVMITRPTNPGIIRLATFRRKNDGVNR